MRTFSNWHDLRSIIACSSITSGAERRLREQAIELFDERAGRFVLALLEHRPRRLEQGVGQPLRILGHAEVEVVRVVVLALLVRDAAERQVRQILDRVVAAVDEEREAILVGLLDDLAQVAARHRKPLLARGDQAAEIQRRGVKARLPVDLAECRRRARQIAFLVGDLAAQVRALVLAVVGQRVLDLDPFELSQDRGLLARLQRGVDHRPVGGGEVGMLGAVTEHAQQVSLRRIVGARARERPAERELRRLVLGRVGKARPARRFDDAEQARGRGLRVAGDQVVLGRSQDLFQLRQRRRLRGRRQHARLLEIGQVLADRIAAVGLGFRRRRGQRLVRVRAGRGRVGLLSQQQEQRGRDHFSVSSSTSISGSYSGASPSSSPLIATRVRLPSGTMIANVCSET